MIGDGATCALVGVDGSISWMCVPEFDSEPLFCGLLDRERGGALHDRTGRRVRGPAGVPGRHRRARHRAALSFGRAAADRRPGAAQRVRHRRRRKLRPRGARPLGGRAAGHGPAPRGVRAARRRPGRPGLRRHRGACLEAPRPPAPSTLEPAPRRPAGRVPARAGRAVGRGAVLGSLPPPPCAERRGDTSRHGRILATLDAWFPLQRSRGAAGSARCDHAQDSRQLVPRLGRGGGHLVAPGAHRWCAELGLPLHLDPRRLLHRVRAAPHRVRRGGGRVPGVGAGLLRTGGRTAGADHVFDRGPSGTRRAGGSRPGGLSRVRAGALGERRRRPAPARRLRRDPGLRGPVVPERRPHRAAPLGGSGRACERGRRRMAPGRPGHLGSPQRRSGLHLLDGAVPGGAGSRGRHRRAAWIPGAGAGWRARRRSFAT